MTICEMLSNLQTFWTKYNVKSVVTWDMQMGAATFHPMCFFNCVKNKALNFMYLQPSRRPSDGKYGLSPNRVVRHHQFQVIISPMVNDIRDIYLESLYALGFSPKNDDIRFIENNWESTALGAFGIGWEVWINGMEVTQFTFFTKIADIELDYTVVELAYGVERMALMLNHCKSFYDLEWDNGVYYKDLFLPFEQQATKYYLEMQNLDTKMEYLAELEKQVYQLLDAKLPIMAYELILEYNKTFNLLISGRLITHVERKGYLNTMRAMVNRCANVALN